MCPLARVTKTHSCLCWQHDPNHRTSQRNDASRWTFLSFCANGLVREIGTICSDKNESTIIDDSKGWIDVCVLGFCPVKSILHGLFAWFVFDWCWQLPWPRCRFQSWITRVKRRPQLYTGIWRRLDLSLWILDEQIGRIVDQRAGRSLIRGQNRPPQAETCKTKEGHSHWWKNWMGVRKHQF